MSEGDWETGMYDSVIEHMETTTVFEQLGIDDSCGGRSLGVT